MAGSKEVITAGLSGVCSTEITFSVDEDGLLSDVSFDRGCQGNLKAVARLVEGRSVEEVTAMFLGITCGSKETSCPDQVARVLQGLSEISDASESS